MESTVALEKHKLFAYLYIMFIVVVENLLMLIGVKQIEKWARIFFPTRIAYTGCPG